MTTEANLSIILALLAALLVSLTVAFTSPPATSAPLEQQVELLGIEYTEPGARIAGQFGFK